MNAAQVSGALDTVAEQTGLSKKVLASALLAFLEELRKGARFPWSVLLSLLAGYIAKATRT